MHLGLERWASPISPLLLVTDTKGILRALEYADYEARMHWLLRRHYGSYILEEGAAPRSLTQALDAYFAGCIDVLAGVEIATGGTRFQRRVWRALSAIPAGTTVSYGQFAGHLGENRASRAVGARTARIRSPLLCLVIGSSGRTAGSPGYAGGLLRKQWLLEHEASFSTLAACESVSRTADRSECDDLPLRHPSRPSVDSHSDRPLAINNQPSAINPINCSNHPSAEPAGRKIDSPGRRSLG